MKLYRYMAGNQNFTTTQTHCRRKCQWIDLKEHIANLKANHSQQLNTVWVSCEGENPADQENIGPISYIPRRGFPGYFYPFENSEGYLSPLVAIHFVRPRSKCSFPM